MKKRLLALILALSMVISIPAVGLATVDSDEELLNEALEISEELKEEALQAIEEVEIVKETEEIVKDVIETIEEFESKIKEGGKFFDIYDRWSIRARLSLYVEAIRAIRIATTQLTNKTVDVHNRIGYDITKAVIVATSPASTVDEIEDTRADLRILVREALESRDLDDNDVATIYIKNELTKKIWQTRFTRDKKVLGKADFKDYHKLNRAITKAVGVELSPWSTVAEVREALVDLDVALIEALAAVK